MTTTHATGGERPLVSPASVPALLMCLAAPAFFVARMPWVGGALVVAAMLGAVLVERRGRAGGEDRDQGSGSTASAPSIVRDLSLIGVGLVIVNAIDLRAELHDLAMLRFTLALGGAVVVPYAISRWVYRDDAIRFPWRGGHRWRPWQWAWLGGVLVLGWLILPFYFITSGVYQNWPAVHEWHEVARLFVGVNAVGTWDELFFICTVFALLLRHFPTWQANLLQAVIFVSFLYELGYRSWGPLLTFPFALLQGWIFGRTRTLPYVLTVHLLFDLIVFLVIVHARNPGAVPIFLW